MRRPAHKNIKGRKKKKMARKKLVTRSVDLTEVEYLAIDIDSQKTFISTGFLPGQITDAKKAEKKLSDMLADSATIRLVKVNKLTPKSTLYGMTEEDFIKVAKVMTSRTQFEN